MPHKTKAPINLGHGPEYQHPSGRILTVGDEFTIKGEGRFVFRYLWPPDGSIACFGPINPSNGAPVKDAKARYFNPDRITRIHNRRATA